MLKKLTSACRQLIRNEDNEAYAVIPGVSPNGRGTYHQLNASATKTYPAYVPRCNDAFCPGKHNDVAV